MNYRERESIVNQPTASPARGRVTPTISRASLVSLILASIVAVTGCSTEPDSSEVQRHPENFRCRYGVPDGSCTSGPVNCPVTVTSPGRPTEPHCAQGGEIIPIAEDDCAHKLICID